jgi:uncharacterized membrane protein HdeD (DUF308 family)
MTANVSSSQAMAGPSGHTGVRVLIGLLGAATLVVGVVLLFHPVAAAHTLALLICLAFLLGGLLELAVGWNSQPRWPSLLLGAVLLIGGVLAAVWPRPTLFTVALVVGVSLIVHGGTRVGIALLDRDELPNWGWWVLAGALNVVAGVIAIAWPKVTVLVLSLILGAQIAAFGLLLLVAVFVRPHERADGQIA